MLVSRGQTSQGVGLVQYMTNVVGSSQPRVTLYATHRSQLAWTASLWDYFLTHLMVVYPAPFSAQRITEHSYLTLKNGFLCTVASVEGRLHVGCQGLGYSLQAVCVQKWGGKPVADLFSPDS